MRRACRISVLIMMFAGYYLFGSENINISTERDQKSIEVTVYNSELGLVKDVRSVKLPEGTGELRFMDVASGIIPETVRSRSLGDPGRFSVLEQNYEYDLMSSDKLLDKYVGKKIKIVDWKEFQDRKEVTDAVLLSNNDGQIYKINDEIYLGHPGYKVLPEIPGNLIAKPTLMWLFDNRSKKQHDLEVSYLTGSIGWKADYVAVLNSSDTESDISGWVTIDNRSGASYGDATLKLVAGDVGRVMERPDRMYAMEKMRVAAAAPQFEEKSFFEYHIYNLERKTTIKDNQTKQISLLEASGIKVVKEFIVYGNSNFFTREYGDEDPKVPVYVNISFDNSKKNGLGMALPAGTMRVYKRDSDNSQQFIGEDVIDHTPKDEKVKLKIGKAFDITAERRQTDYKRVSTNLHESDWEITIRNHKEETVSVGIIEKMHGNWDVIKKSHPYKKLDAFSIRFDVNVPKDGEVKVGYRIKMGI